MSSNPDDHTTQRFDHEDTHVWQNRLVGPFYTLSYIGWMVLLLIPGFIAGLIAKQDGITAWSYFNNPWEAMGYDVGQSHKGIPGPARTAFGSLIWSATAVYIAGAIYFALFLALAVYIVYRVWFRP